MVEGVGGDGPRDNLTDDRGLIYGTLDFDIGDDAFLDALAHGRRPRPQALHAVA